MITPTNMMAGGSMAYRNPNIHTVSPVENLRNFHVQQLSPSSMSSSSSSTRSPVMRLSQTGATASGVAAPGGSKKRVQTARICQIEGCTRGIRSRGLCKAHGGGRRCTTPGCTTSDQGGGHCVLHGGGRRCRVEGCMKSAQWRGVCKLHGGARRCRYGHCTKNGQVKQGYCRLHYNLLTQQQLQLKLHPGQTNSENGSEGDESKEDSVQAFSP
uniref:WRKY19-like zinc finger domain-containing protein n=1 Tax=Globisporangium ultimum (strain ATCC 200006 / CBS 805.95 / DAOM BR144) TaxID=431595 RepID=K3WQS5_GLOUD